MTLVARVFGLAAFLCIPVALPAQAICPFAQMQLKTDMSPLAFETRIAARVGKANPAALTPTILQAERSVIATVTASFE